MAVASNITELQKVTVELEETRQSIRKTDKKLDTIGDKIDEHEKTLIEQPDNVDVRDRIEQLTNRESQLGVEKSLLLDKELFLMKVEREKYLEARHSKARPQATIYDADYKERTVPIGQETRKEEIEALLECSFKSIEVLYDEKWVDFPATKITKKDLTYTFGAGNRYRIVQDIESNNSIATDRDPLIKKDA